MIGWPRTLFGRVAAIVLAGVASAYVLSLWPVMHERMVAARAMMLSYVSRDVSSSIAILERLPAAERSAWLERLSRPNYRIVPAGTVPAVDAAPTLARYLAAELRAHLGPWRVPRVKGDGSGGAVLAIRLRDGASFDVHVRAPPGLITPATAVLLLLQLGVIGAFVWWAVRVATRPLTTLAEAAARIGPDAQAPALTVAGPIEVQQAARAFNLMQQRIAAQMSERLQILAAVSHDLQTPITRMRMRAELLADGTLRDRLQADLQHMQHLVEEGLAYARTAHAATEPAMPVALRDLLDGMACDCADAGHHVTLTAPQDIVVTTRPQALKRIVSNLLDNALKFAGQAELLLMPEGDGALIVVRDHGPGIAPDQIAHAMQPFYRVEASRNRDTGGSGLGLAIADRLSHALGAQLELINRAEGGLDARLRLPARPDQEPA